jgi:hypothetical protein
MKETNTKLVINQEKSDQLLEEGSLYETLWYEIDQACSDYSLESLTSLIGVLNLHINELSEARGNSDDLFSLLILLSELREKCRKSLDHIVFDFETQQKSLLKNQLLPVQ